MTAAGLPKTETLAQFARRLGVNRSTITRAKQAGRLVMHESGRVMVEASLRNWHETKGHRDDVAARHAENRGRDVPNHQPDPENATAAQKIATPRNNSATSDADTEPEGGNTRTSYKAMVLKYENDSIKLEMALRRGLRFATSDIKREALSLGGSLRAGIERLIDQTAPRLAVMTDRAARERLLNSEVRTLRRMIRAEFVRAMRRLKQKEQSA